MTEPSNEEVEVAAKAMVDRAWVGPPSELARAALTAAAQVRERGDWQRIETAPKDGRFIWLSDGRFMRVGYWYCVTKDPSQEHWADMIRTERGGMGDLQWVPKYWMPVPKSPDHSATPPLMPIYGATEDHGPDVLGIKKEEE